MLTGELPFGMVWKDNSERVILEKIQGNKEEFSQPVFKDIPQIVGLLRQMLNPDAKERPKMSEIDEQIKKL